MSENAPGQLLGFTIQYPRALCHLLRATDGCTVCIEVHGDVATLDPLGRIHAEEDKSSISNNPVTDKSTDLWKTFSNWVNSIITGELDAETTTFILYRNKPGRPGLVDKFHDANTLDQVEAAIQQARLKLDKLETDHGIQPYYKNCTIDNIETFKKIIKNFRLETGSGAGYDDVEKEIRNHHIPDSQIAAVAESINGWLVRVVSEKISNKADARITWKEFNGKFITLFDRARRLELIDFTLNTPPSPEEIKLQISLRPTYLRQIELINGDDDDIIGAVTDFIRAKTNRDRWIEDDLLDETLAADFEEKLERYWNNSKKTSKITGIMLTKENRGKWVYYDCMKRQETLRGAAPPASTIEGTYHALANTPKLGWHEDWEGSFKND